MEDTEQHFAGISPLHSCNILFLHIQTVLYGFFARLPQNHPDQTFLKLFSDTPRTSRPGKYISFNQCIPEMMLINITSGPVNPIFNYPLNPAMMFVNISSGNGTSIFNNPLVSAINLANNTYDHGNPISNNPLNPATMSININARSGNTIFINPKRKS